jgi:putative hydrolase of the HAD superfamily
VIPLAFRECKAVLFDFGGTLDSDGEHWLDRFYALYRGAGLDIPLPEIKRAFYHADAMCSANARLVSLGLRPLMKCHVRLQFESLELRRDREEEEMVDAFCSKSEGFLRRNALLLGSLRRRYRLGLVSNFYGNVAALCDEAGLASLFEVILDSANMGISKPNPEIFRTALCRMDLLPDRVIFVGDSYERDMIPAKELGMKTVWLKGPSPRIPLQAPPVDAAVSSLYELEALIL